MAPLKTGQPKRRALGFGANTARELFAGFAISNIRRPFRLNYSGQTRKQNLLSFHGCQYPVRFEDAITVRLNDSERAQ